MQDFSPIRLSSDVSVWTPTLPLSEEDMDKMESDPQSMYLYSLRTHNRLPERLHEAMLLHSFDPECRQNVQMYLSWVSACEERAARMESFKKSEAFRDRAIMFSMALVTVSYLVLAFALAF